MQFKQWFCPFCRELLTDESKDQVVKATAMTRNYGCVDIKIHLSCMEFNMTERQVKNAIDSRRIREWEEKKQRIEELKASQKMIASAFHKKRKKARSSKMTLKDREEYQEYLAWKKRQ